MDKKTVERFKKWLLSDCQYSINHAGRLLSLLKILGLDAQKNDPPTHPYIHFIRRFSLPHRDKIIHTLSFAEIKQVVDTAVPLPLVRAKKWLIIGFWLGQRVSDLLSLRPEQIRFAKNGGLYVDIVQQKTGRQVTIGVSNPIAVRLLTQEFPRKMYPSAFNKKNQSNS